MDKLIDLCLDLLIKTLRLRKRWDTSKTIKEFMELSQSLANQALNQIPGVSALAALLVGAWVASTFTTSPIKAALAEWGLIDGGRQVVSGHTFQFLSVFLPLAVAGVTAYLVQKLLKRFRERQMATHMALTAQLSRELRRALQDKLAILEQAKEADLISAGEYLTKKAALYRAYARIRSAQIEDFIIHKFIK